MAKRGPRFTKLERAINESKIVRLELLGTYTQLEIANKVGVSPSMVSKVLTAFRAELKKATVADVAEVRKRELEKLDRLEREFFEAWEKSKREGKKPGRHTFLMGIIRCVKERADLLGLYQPPPRVFTGPGGGPIQLTISDKRKAVVDQMLTRLLEDGMSLDEARTGLLALGVSADDLAAVSDRR